MLDLCRFLRGWIADLFRSRAALVAENVLLRQQLIVAERKNEGRVRWTPWQRLLMTLAARFTPAWRTVTLLVQPATILRWHRAGLRAFWRNRSRSPGVRRHHEPRSSEKWRQTTHGGEPNGSAVSY